MELTLADIRKAKLVLEEAVREADIAVKASFPSLEELDKIQKAFDESVGHVARMINPSPAPAACPRKPGDH
ncbi:MAG: hypothetical protein QOH06_5208 [Acidobacteriota bacterium]|jgi:hypothetical protein|nr:hypothetical protein [Acidobacteriota bacterium]